jgi:catechol 2,3-dioxygenase-like lactoylglutathione lyase family enzyme
MQFHQVQLKTHNLSSLIHFYRDVLEMPVTENAAGRLSIHTAHTNLVFDETADSSGNPVYHFAMNIPSNTIEEAYQWLKDRTTLLWLEDYNSYIADFVNWHAKSVYFLDPAGNIVEFIARFDLQDNVAEHFSSKQIRNISEVGIVFPGTLYRQSTEKLVKDNNLHYFSKQPTLENFCAIGDDEGLFIVVPESRSWYPCADKPAGIYPLEVSFTDSNTTFNIRLK